MSILRETIRSNKNLKIIFLLPNEMNIFSTWNPIVLEWVVLEI
jgi:hypothetical protein